MREEARGGFHGINIGRSVPSISHLMFADDIILFCRARNDEVRAVWRCITKYQEWSRQKVNIKKSGLMFSNNCSEGKRREIIGVLGIQECNKEIYYLGNPLFLGRNRGKSFAKLKKRVHDRLEGWMAKSISKAGRSQSRGSKHSVLFDVHVSASEVFLRRARQSCTEILVDRK